MHPELRRARSLYHDWRCLPDPLRARLSPFAREVKELALDLRGHTGADADAATRDLAHANTALEAILRSSAFELAA